ncbi:TrmH family RNA methyltransferase [Allorhizocola rhizosphaerae]|uniref:TrmH family RNA methyltransferase n=1 Tax=Allorhizocola rhizosphaerae TaxID=1872709 RepID=UPI000E3BD542|nr:RNA methyltransferase [Allorhizocola rhizosphaerae]
MNSAQRPGDRPFTTRTPRVSAAIKLQRRREREKAGLFLAEGPQAVREAVAAGVVRELFVTADRAGEYPDASVVTDEAMAALAETVTPQGVVAVCELVDVSLNDALAKQPRLVAVAVDIRDPGNAGTILRTADAAGANTVIFAGDSVDPHNGKCVRASAGSLFHVDVVRERETGQVLDALEGMLVLATSGRGESDLFEIEPRLTRKTAWLFGGEAHGLPDEVLARAERVRVPVYGFAESLNLAAAAAVCLYASARAHRSAL